MKVNIEELITLSYEVEGLLHLALHRGDDTPDRVWTIIADKLKTLSDSIPANQPDATTTESIEHQESTETITPIQVMETVVETTASEPKQEHPIAALPINDSDEESGSSTDSEQQNSAIDATQPEISSSYNLSEAAQPVIEVIKTDDGNDMESRAQKCEPTTNKSAIHLDDLNSVPSQRTIQEPVRLDEKLARENSRDLRHAFSLNDKFRFRRELFSNSDNIMSDTINMIEAMTSIDEARDYFFNDLEWDPENPEVIDFLEIVTHHFSGR